MAEALHSESGVLNCSICLEVFNEPKILPLCLHRFCEPCLNQYITESASATTEPHGFLCPCCRICTPVQDASRPRTEWAAQFKTDFVIKELISLRSRGLPGVNHSCPTHKIEYDYFCDDCNILLCHRCAMESHRACKVTCLMEATSKRKIELRQAIEHTVTQLEQATHSDGAHMKLKTIIESKRDMVAAEIKALSDNIRRRVTDEEVKLLHQLNSKCDGLIEEVHSEMSQVKEITDSIECDLNTALSNLSSPDVDFMLDNSVLNIIRKCQQNDFSKAEEILKRITANVHDVQFTFHKASPPSEFLGSIKVACDFSNSDGLDAHFQLLYSCSAQHSTAGSMPDSSDRTHSVQVLRTVDVRCGHELTCIRGIVVATPSDHIVVTDFCNSCVLMFYNTGYAYRCERLKGSPWGITQLSETMVVVSLPIAEEICFIQIAPYLEAKTYIKCKPYHSLAALDSVTLVATPSTPSSYIDIINLTGQVLKSIKSCSDSGVHTSRVFTPSLCVSADKMILVYFPTDNCLLCLSENGETKFKYSQDKVSGVSCDSSGRIFLLADNGLLSLTSDGQSDQTLISSADGTLLSPTAVSVDREGHVYVVNNDGCEIKVFSFAGLYPSV